MKTVYLFGEGAVDTLMHDGIDALIVEIENGVEYDTFVFTEGETKSTELMENFNGWRDYAVIDEHEYNRIIKTVL